MDKRMPVFKQTPEIQRLLSNAEAIRNLGIIAHIDHGKTTLTDALLAGAGLLSPQMVGSARVLDYLEEEQKRRITIKASNISFLYKTSAESFVINLVDTPGHVDFAGKVTRALRSIDGALVVVDSVEEIMTQTEIVTIQALAEGVRPILFINKVDRLIREMQLKSTQIQEKFSRIIANFNNLIETYSDPDFTASWKVNPTLGNVVFGSALHNWGFTLNTSDSRITKFEDIVRAYQTSEIEQLHKKLPLYREIMKAVIVHLPNPRQAQKYRISRIWKGALKSRIGAAMVECDAKGPTAMCITNVQLDPAQGTIVNGRLFSGTIKTGDVLHQVNSRNKLGVQQLSLNMGAFREPIQWASAGNIISLTTQDNTKAGESLTDISNQYGLAPFEQVEYVSEPVVTISVEPTNPSNLPALLLAMERAALEDPNLIVTINKETGEYLLSGIGELHLEIVAKSITGNTPGLDITTSFPRVVYRETITKKGTIVSANSANLQNSFQIGVEPMTNGDLNRNENQPLVSGDHFGQVLVYEKNMLANLGPELPSEIWDSIISGFVFASKSGPLCGEPMRLVRVNLINSRLSGNKEYRTTSEIMHGIGKAVFGSFLTAKPKLLEPYYKTTLSTPMELAGECTRILNARRGKVFSFVPKGSLAVIQARIPVVESFGISEELRTTTSGRATWQLTFDSWVEEPERLANRTITEIRKRKGLPSEVPDSIKFASEE
jgi:elongation factor 2